MFVLPTVMFLKFIGILVFFVWYLLIAKFNMEAAHARGYILALMVFMKHAEHLYQ